MNKWLTTLSVLGAVALALATAAYASATKAAAPAKAHAAAAYKVVYIPGLTGNPFYSTVACGAASVAKSLGVAFSVQGAPTFAVSAQTPIVQAVTASHPNAIMISNDDPKAMIAPLLAAQNAGIKIVNIDGDLSEKSIGVTNIQSNDTLGGKLAGQAMAKLTHQKGDILIIDNSPGFLISEQRRQGLLNVLKKYSGIKILPVQYSNNSTSDAASIVPRDRGGAPELHGRLHGRDEQHRGRDHGSARGPSGRQGEARRLRHLSADREGDPAGGRVRRHRPVPVRRGSASGSRRPSRRSRASRCRVSRRSRSSWQRSRTSTRRRCRSSSTRQLARDRARPGESLTEGARSRAPHGRSPATAVEARHQRGPASRRRRTSGSRSGRGAHRDLRSSDQGERVQPMRGFEDGYVDIVD